MAEQLMIFGASGHGKVIADAAMAAGWSVLGFADDDPTRAASRVLGLPVTIGFAEALSRCRREGASLVFAIGDNGVRKRLFEEAIEAGVQLARVIHPRAVVAPSVTVGAGTVVFAGAVINPDSVIGQNVIVNTSASLDHDNRIGDHAHLSPGANLGGTVSVGEGTHVGIGACVKNNISIGSWSVIGAGSVVVKDLPSEVVAYGNPARVIRPNEQRHRDDS